MVQNIKRIADRLGAETVLRVPETGGGAFGAARLAGIIEYRRRCLVLLAELASSDGRKVSPMQIAAQSLEEE